MDGVVHFEIPASNMDRAKTFYEKTFGWKLNQYTPDYCLAGTTPVDDQRMPITPGVINGAIQEKSPEITMPRIVVNVEDIDLAIKTVESNGGKLLQPKAEVPDMLIYAVIEDTEGNEVGLAEYMRNKT